MAFITATKRGRFEVRESSSTPRGPRSRTLVTFDELTDEVIAKARAKATNPPSPGDLRQAARRAGAPIAAVPADRAARELIAELGKGNAPAPPLRHLLADLLSRRPFENGGEGGGSEAGEAIAEWMAATPRERGKTLVDLLLLADALPHGSRVGKPLRYPRLESGAR